jgi:hypothetical protein
MLAEDWDDPLEYRPFRIGTYTFYPENCLHEMVADRFAHASCSILAQQDPTVQ